MADMAVFLCIERVVTGIGVRQCLMASAITFATNAGAVMPGT
jgi:hypothetical protein